MSTKNDPEPFTASGGSEARDRGVLAGHKCYEGNPYEDNPYADGTQESLDWLVGWIWAFESAEANDV